MDLGSDSGPSLISSVTLVKSPPLLASVFPSVKWDPMRERLGKCPGDCRVQWKLYCAMHMLAATCTWMERAFLRVKLDLNCTRPVGGPQVGDGAQAGERLGHEECLSVPASIPDRCAAYDVGCVVPTSPLGSDDSKPGTARDSGHACSD